MPTTVHLTLTLEQAQAVCDALDLYSRLGIGQIEEVASLVRSGMIPTFRSAELPRAVANIDACEQVETLLHAVKQALGYPRHGSYGIGHAHVAKGTHRCFETKKALEQALALHRNPNPEFRGVNYDGLLLRYTRDPAPVARVTTEA